MKCFVDALAGLLATAVGMSAETVWIAASVDRATDRGETGSLEEALQAVRTARRQGDLGRAVIELRGGRHELASPLELGPEDSNLTLRARSGETPILVGGRRLTGWRRVETNAALWELSVPEVRDGRWYFRQLFFNGIRQPRARTPNEGYFRTTARLGTQSPITLPFRAGDLRPSWAGDFGAELILLMKWTDLHVPILSVDTAAGVAVIPGGPRANWMDEPDARYWVENVPEALDQPGEWTLDRKTGWLRWWAPEGVDPNAAFITAPRLTELVRIQGDLGSRTPVRGIRWEGLTFAEADYALPDSGLISPQAAVPVPGAFRATHAVEGTIEDCRFEGLGGYGLELGRGCQRWRVVGNQMLQLGGGGIRLGEPGDRSPSDFDANHGHQLTDNVLRGLGRIFAPAVGIIVFQSGTNRIAYNHVADLFYTGISVGWNWGYQETPCRANVIENNLVEQVGQGRLSDMGGIYTLGPQPGTVIRNNVFREVESYGYGGWGLYTDEGSSGIVLENNVATRCKSAGFHQHYGRDNVVRFNLFAFNREHQLMRTREEPHRSFWFTNNIVVWDSGELLGSNWRGTTDLFLLDRNLYFDTRLGTNVGAYRFAGQTWDEWQARGQDVNSAVDQPQWLDPRQPERGFQPGSSAGQVGFRPERLVPLGPRPKEDRR